MRLVFSALTVLGWSSDIFGSKVRAIGFTALLEGIMMTADAGWLSAIALGSAVANGCRLALRSFEKCRCCLSGYVRRALMSAGIRTTDYLTSRDPVARP